MDEDANEYYNEEDGEQEEGEMNEVDDDYGNEQLDDMIAMGDEELEEEEAEMQAQQLTFHNENGGLIDSNEYTNELDQLEDRRNSGILMEEDDDDMLEQINFDKVVMLKTLK